MFKIRLFENQMLACCPKIRRGPDFVHTVLFRSSEKRTSKVEDEGVTPKGET